VTLSLDVRHGDDTLRAGLCNDLRARAEQIAWRRGVRVDWRVVQESPAVLCAPDLVRTLEQAVAARGYRVLRLSSGAGHDAVAMADLTPMAMLFVRCRRGISHNPAESIEEADVAAAAEVMLTLLALLAEGAR
jgi:allantoate deiminase